MTNFEDFKNKQTRLETIVGAGLLAPEEAELLRRELVAEFDVNRPYIYLVWNINADSYNGFTTLGSIHQTLSGAIATIPENMKNLERPSERYVRDYVYRAIERKEVPA